MSADAIATWLPAVIVIVGATVAGIWAVVNRRGGERAARKNPLPPTWPEMWDKIATQDDKIQKLEEKAEARDKEIAARDLAFAHILADAAEQWPADKPGPVFDRADIEALGDTVPTKWVKRIRPA